MSQMGYARTYPEFWSGSLAGLDDTARSLAHFLYSAHNLTPFGLYYKEARSMAHEFRRTEAQTRKALTELCRVAFCCYDDATGFVWVREMAAWQLKPLPLKPNNLLIKSARRWYAQLPRNPFLGPYFDRYDIELLLSNPDAFPGTEIVRREWVARPEPEAPPPPQLAPPPEGIDRRGATTCGEEEFESWWSHYPQHRRSGKKPALEKWLRKRIPAEELPRLIAMLERQKQSYQWRKEDGKFIPMPLTYVNQERWNDAVRAAAPEESLNRTNQGTIDTLKDLMGHEDRDAE